ncbi:MAG: hypothetical protein K9J42_10805 [Sulfuritalea sp.]|nr:hypothetical protein [Sulfuritalea sp.]
MKPHSGPRMRTGQAGRRWRMVSLENRNGAPYTNFIFLLACSFGTPLLCGGTS